MRFLAILFTLAAMLSEMVHAQDTPMLMGYGKIEDLQNAPYNEWFDANYNHYTPEEELVEKLDSRIPNDNTITIVMGTWCSDSRREVPRFIKILDQIGFPHSMVKMVYVDRNKDDGNGEAQKLHIDRVPTFILFDGQGKERSRIVETPRKTLEKDLLKILKRH